LPSSATETYGNVSGHDTRGGKHTTRKMDTVMVAKNTHMAKSLFVWAAVFEKQL
jgi:hypothetical protein